MQVAEKILSPAVGFGPATTGFKETLLTLEQGINFIEIEKMLHNLQNRNLHPSVPMHFATRNINSQEKI